VTAGVGTAAVVSVLLAASLTTGTTWTVAVGVTAVGAVGLAATAALADRPRLVARTTAPALYAPVGLFLLGGLAAGLAAIGPGAPVLVAVAGLVVPAATGLAVYGAASLWSDASTRTTFARAVARTVAAGVPLVGLAIAAWLLGSGWLGRLIEAGAGLPPVLVGWSQLPSPTETGADLFGRSLSVFLLLLATTLFTTGLAASRLPTRAIRTALLDLVDTDDPNPSPRASRDRSDDAASADAVATANWIARALWVLAVAVGGAGVVIPILVEAARVRTFLVTPPVPVVGDLAMTIVLGSSVRAALGTATALAIGAVVAHAVWRRLRRVSPVDIVRTFFPFGGGLLLCVVALVLGLVVLPRTYALFEQMTRPGRLRLRLFPGVFDAFGLGPPPTVPFESVLLSSGVDEFLIRGIAVRGLLAGLSPVVEASFLLLAGVCFAGLSAGATALAGSLGQFSPGGRAPAFASGGTFAVVTATALAGAAPVAVVTGIAVALLTWDVALHSTGLAREVGPGRGTHVELVHAVASLLVAAVGSLFAVGGLVALDVSVPQDVALPALAVAVVGISAFVVLLRG
jgi:hypothetical protein